jgi:plastocyanin
MLIGGLSLADCRQNHKLTLMSMPPKKDDLFRGNSSSYFLRFYLILGVIISLPLSTQAATFYVTVNGSSFSPATLNIDVGDTVIWENTDVFFSHSTTSNLDLFDPNYWDGWMVDTEDTYGRLFDSPGIFSYHDQFDTGTGTITVNQTFIPVIMLETPREVGHQFLFDATGLTVGKTNVLQASSSLTDWVSVATNIAATASLTFTNTTTPTQRYFRLFELP